MENIKTFLETANSNNSTEFGRIAEPNRQKEYGFLMYDEESGTIVALHANTADEIADAYSCDSEEIYNKVFELKVGESINLHDQGLWCRIW